MMEEQKVQTFILSSIDPAFQQKMRKVLLYTYLFYAVLIIILILCFHIPFALCFVGFLIVSLMPVLVILIIAPLNKKFQKQQVLEFYPDKIVITGIDEGTVMFKDIAFYKIVKSKIYLLHIGLRNGQDIRIVNGLDGGLDAFIKAFKERVNQLNSEEHLSIVEKGQFADWI